MTIFGFSNWSIPVCVKIYARILHRIRSRGLYYKIYDAVRPVTTISTELSRLLRVASKDAYVALYNIINYDVVILYYLPQDSNF